MGRQILANATGRNRIFMTILGIASGFFVLYVLSMLWFFGAFWCQCQHREWFQQPTMAFMGIQLAGLVLFPIQLLALWLANLWRTHFFPRSVMRVIGVVWVVVMYGTWLMIFLRGGNMRLV